MEKKEAENNAKRTTYEKYYVLIGYAFSIMGFVVVWGNSNFMVAVGIFFMLVGLEYRYDMNVPKKESQTKTKDTLK